MTQFQIKKTDLTETRFVDQVSSQTECGENEISVRIERFGFSANNITYAVMGEGLNYWKFFPALGDQAEDWGVLPVWGFAEVMVSNVPTVPVGERLFGYFPPSEHLTMAPIDVSERHFFDGAEHRAQLPRGYNIYQRVNAEPGYTKTADDLRMLLFPLYITSFCLWDLLKENDWYGAKQVIIVSASSKTRIGMAYALDADETSPKVIGLTSQRNIGFVDGLDIYDSVIGYDAIADKVEKIPSVIVDMSGNAEVLGHLHRHLGDDMVRTVNVGLTHWDGARGDKNIIKERSEFFFAPTRIQKRMKDWGPGEFNAQSSAFVFETAMKSRVWLELKKIDGLKELDEVYAEVRDGRTPPNCGLIVEL